MNRSHMNWWMKENAPPTFLVYVQVRVLRRDGMRVTVTRPESRQWRQLAARQIHNWHHIQAKLRPNQEVLVQIPRQIAIDKDLMDGPDSEKASD